MKLNFYFFICIFLNTCLLKAQDSQYSQYYNAPLQLNPAFTGQTENTRAVFNYRNQWPGLNRPYRVMSFSADHLIEPARTGIGLLVRKDEQGASSLSVTELGILGSYNLEINRYWSFVPGVQVSWINRSLNYKDLVFGDQIDPGNPSSFEPSQDALASNNRTNYLDISTGALLFSENFWLGLSLNHLNTPNQSFLNSENGNIPIKATFTIGYKFDFTNTRSQGPEQSLTPTMLYKVQAGYYQMDLGLYGKYGPFMTGLWYRGIPLIRPVENVLNQDALIIMAGVYYKGFTCAYSYDFTLSPLRKYTGGSHEITIIYEWKIPYRYKKVIRPLPCPNFYRSGR